MSNKKISDELQRYLHLEQAIILLDGHENPESDSVRDIMDIVWQNMSVNDREWINSRDNLQIKDEQKPADFLTDPEDIDENVDYVQPNIEHKLPAAKRMECRQIVQEVRNFGVSQRQMLYLIYLLALELEDRPTMLALTKAIGENRERTPVSNLIKPTD